MAQTESAWPPKQFIQELRSRFRLFPRSRRRCTIVSITEDSSPIFCLIRAGMPLESTTAEVREYGRCHLLRENVSLTQLIAKLRRTNTTQCFSVASRELRFESLHCPIRSLLYPSGSNYHERPGGLYELATSIQNVAFFSREPLLAPTLTPYFHLQDAITEWTGVNVSDSDGRFRKLLLFLPSFEASIDGVSFDKGMLTVKTTSSRRGKCSLAVLVSDHRRTERISVPLKRTTTLTIMEEPRRLHIYVTGQAGEVLDRFVDEETYCTGTSVIFGQPHQERALLDLIYGGESDVVEFKTFITPSDKVKWREVVETVMAFANTRGGTILVGVEDDGEIRGISSGPSPDRETSQFQAEYKKRLRALLQQGLNRLPTVSIEIETVAGQPLMVVRVGASATPISTLSGARKLLVRRGANNMAPDWDSFLAAQSTNLLSHFGDGGSAD